MTTSLEDLLASFIGRSHPSSAQAQSVGIPALDPYEIMASEMLPCTVEIPCAGHGTTDNYFFLRIIVTTSNRA
jgi:hypothetical protein